MNEYFARYSILSNGALMGVENMSIEADSDEEAVKMALQNEEDYSCKKRQLFLEYITNENGDEIKIEY